MRDAVLGYHMTMVFSHGCRSGDARRRAALEGAARVLAKRGYENTRYIDVSVASGLAVSTLQNYFGSREAMLIETLRYATDVELSAMDGLAEAGVDPWSRLVALIDRNLKTHIHNHQLLIEFWRAGMRDAESRNYAHDHWACYRAPFLKTVIEGCDESAFSPTLTPDDVVDLLLGMLTGAMVPRVLQFPAPTASRFRSTLLNQVAQMLGRAVADRYIGS
jgi:AcrR family transcriptional regulator